MNKKITIIGDLHTHTIASGHAYGTIRENAHEAKAKSLKVLGITDHAPGIPGTIHPFYYENFKVVPRMIDEVLMLFGSEVNVLNDGTLSLDENLMKKLDYCIAGMHDLCYQDVGRVQNTTNLISCMKHPKVKIVSHPDTDAIPLDYERLVKAAVEYNVALEVNNSSLIKVTSRINCVENYHTMLKLCMKYRCPIVVDSDAHDPFYVGEFSRAIKLLEEVGFDEELIINANLDRLYKHLEIKKATNNNPDMGI